MKQCAVCSRTYANDALEFCLEDGQRLFLISEATRVPGDSGSGAGGWLPQPLPPPSWSGQPMPVQPTPPPPAKSVLPIILYSLVALVALIGGALGILAYMRSSPAETTRDKPAPQSTPKTRPVVADSPEEAPTPTPKAVKPTPPPATPKPTPYAEIPEATPKPPAPKPSGCVIQNDDPSQPDVNFRKDCHIKSCDDDKSTLAGRVSNGTGVTVNRQVAPVPGKFSWQQVTLSNGRVGWVASSKIRCP